MEREPFSSPAIAEPMHRELESVKVDREERPEIDAIYMTPTQILTLRGRADSAAGREAVVVIG